jgi:ATP-dependent helicase/nuclease subunit B
VITPRRTTLTTVPDLRALHRAIADACAATDPADARATVVLVPTRASGSELRRTLERIWLLDAPSARAVVFPDLLTRPDFYRRLAEGRARRLSEFEREALLGAAAREAVDAGARPPFRMRPGLVAGMLAFYDTLRRQQRSVADFERLVLDDLAPRAEFDRGAERLLRQTRFLAAAFHAFEARTAASGGLDEHGVRERALAGEAAPVPRRVVVTIGDRVGEPAGGLFPADFDLLARAPGIESIDILATRASLLAGLGERLRGLLPGIDERDREASSDAPALVRPAGSEGRSCFVNRDREEELREIARRIKRDLRCRPAPRVAVVFRRPLPYVYLGRTVFDAARIEHQAADALPLAAEPFAAALDLVFAAVASRFARDPLLQLLRSPHFSCAHDGGDPSLADLDGLDRGLAESGYLGDAQRLRAFADRAPARTAVAARAAAAVAAELEPLGRPATLSSHLGRLRSFIRARERAGSGDEATRSRHLRARAAVIRILDGVREAALAHGDPSVVLDDVAPLVRRWLESETFTPARGNAGVHLADAPSARYGDFDDVHLAGVVAGDWPEASARDIFYPSFLLSRLGWPSEADRLAAERAAFRDLLGLARRRVSVSAFLLEDDAIVEPSPLLEEIERTGLSAHHPAEAECHEDEARDEEQARHEDEAREAEGARHRVFVDEALTGDPPDPGPLPADAAAWVRLRMGRSPAAAARFHGDTAEARVPPPERGYTVTGIDRYCECPFKYFAATVLGLSEEPADEAGITPKERGRFVHEVFRSFFTAWQSKGTPSITVADLDRARALFSEVADACLDALPPAEAALERTRLLGSVAAPGLAEIALAAEAVRPVPVRDRLLEYPFEGVFEMEADGIRRAVRLRGKADRVDLLADGSMRVVDYKIGRAPVDSIQLPVYVLCLLQHFERSGRPVTVGEALYLAFGERHDAARTVVESAARSGASLEGAERRVIEAVDGIERGWFPPRPASARTCSTCAFAPVCRKDYVDAD